MRILYSFGMQLGASGVGYAAEAQIAAYHRLGHDITVYSASSRSKLPPEIPVNTTFQMGRWRLPLSAIGMERAFAIHDRVVASAIRRGSESFDVVHTWPGCSARTLLAARQSKALAVREAPNTHTANAYAVVEREHLRLQLPIAGSHARNEGRLRAELREYAAADLILVPSELAMEVFMAYGTPAEKLAIKRYGFDPERLAMDPERHRGDRVTFTFIASCEPRKGLHLALQAWVNSGVADDTRFVVLGKFIPGYRESLTRYLTHPNVELRGFVADLRPVYAEADVLVLPSVEDGSALVTYDAQGAGCALLVSRAAGARITHGVEGLVHEPGDVETLADHIRRLATDSELRSRMQRAAYAHAPRLTWDAATQDLIETFKDFGERRARSPA